MIEQTAPDGAQVIDLPAGRAARAEQRAKDGEGVPYLRLSAGYVALKPEVPITAAMAFTNGEIEAGLRLMLKDPADVDLLLSDGLTAPDIDSIGTRLTGRSLGESPASAKPSQKASRR